jgi:hypothetical protein
VPRIGDVPAAADGTDTLMKGSPWLLWELVPGEHFEQGGHVSVNAAGLRDRVRDKKARPRAMALGDSSVYGFGVDDDEVFTARLESTLPADFLNAAVPGYSTWQSLNLLRGRGLAFDPDLLIVGNLWSDNNFDSFVDAELLADYAGWTESPASRLRHVLQGSALFRGLDWHLRVARRAEAVREVGWQAGSDAPRSGRRRVPIRDYATNLLQFCAIMHERSGGVVFLLLPNREDISARAPSPAWAPYRKAMREVASACQAPLVDGPAAFTASGASADVLFLDQMHPTAAGHAILADAVATALTGAGWPQAPLRMPGPPTVLSVPPDPYEGHGGAAESAQARPASLTLSVRVPVTLLPATLAVHDADDPGAVEPLGSAPLPVGLGVDGPADVLVRLRRLPGRARIDVEGKGRRSATVTVTGGRAEVDLR